MNKLAIALAKTARTSHVKHITKHKNIILVLLLITVDDISATDFPFSFKLTIKAPNAKLPQISENATLEDKINYVLYSEVNPGLAAHGGEVSLIEVLDKEIAILQFGGGCQGCGMVDLTLKDGVEKTLLEQVDGLKSVRDVTDHSYRENAYYK